MKGYFLKMRGGAKSPPGIGFGEIVWSWAGAAIGVGLCGYLSSRFFEMKDLTLLIGSFGASAVLIYGAVKSPFSQPRNLLGGHVISGIIGVACHRWCGDPVWLGAALAVSLAVAAMLVTKTVHPPGGATALIAVIGGDKIYKLGFLYPFLPVGVGVLILLIVGLLVNNISRNRRYPEYWF
jgi:CBS-domain-containing membrane protein